MQAFRLSILRGQSLDQSFQLPTAGAIDKAFFSRSDYNCHFECWHMLAPAHCVHVCPEHSHYSVFPYSGASTYVAFSSFPYFCLFSNFVWSQTLDNSCCRK